MDNDSYLKLFLLFLKDNNLYSHYIMCFNYFNNFKKGRYINVKEFITNTAPESYIMSAFGWGYVNNGLKLNIIWGDFHLKWTKIVSDVRDKTRKIWV